MIDKGIGTRSHKLNKAMKWIYNKNSKEYLVLILQLLILYVSFFGRESLIQPLNSLLFCCNHLIKIHYKIQLINLNIVILSLSWYYSSYRSWQLSSALEKTSRFALETGQHICTGIRTLHIILHTCIFTILPCG